MTLIAAYKVGKSPVLLSDILATGAGRHENKRLPTTVNLHGPLPTDYGQTVTNLVRKSFVISGNFAVAVAGSSLSAKNILNEIFDFVKGEIITLEELKVFMSSIGDYNSTAMDCTFVGWIIEEGCPISFKWRSTAPTIFETGGDYVEGSGRELLLNSCWSKYQSSWELKDSFSHPQHYCLTQIASLVVNEITNGVTLSNLFGCGYDLIIWDGKKFRYASDLTFLILDIKYLLEGNFDRMPIIIRYAQVEDCLVIRSILVENQLGVLGDPEQRERSAIVPPLTSDRKTHRFSKEYNWDEISHFTDPIFVIINKIGSDGKIQHWSAGVRGEEAKMFMLERIAENRIKLILPKFILDNMATKARAQFEGRN